MLALRRAYGSTAQVLASGLRAASTRAVVLEKVNDIQIRDIEVRAGCYRMALAFD